MSLSDRDQVVWLAGLLEGEGCFCYYLSPGIVVGMTDSDVLQRVADILGSKVTGPYKYGANKKAVFYVKIWGDKAIEWMEVLLPLMGSRRTSKIKEIFKRRASAPGKGHALGSARIPKCHPDRKHYAFGLCKPCYRKERYKKGLAR
jgi:hypothetical protein